MPYGTVTDTKVGYVKVYLESFELQLDWIPVVSPFTYKNKAQFNINIGSQVFIVQEKDMFGEIENVCIGATYNEEDVTPFNTITKHGFKMADSEIFVLHGEDTSAVRYGELKTYLDSLQATINSLITEYKIHVHTSAAPSNPTTPPTASVTGLNNGNAATIKSDYIKLR